MQPDVSLDLLIVLLGLFGITGLVEHSLYGGFNRAYYSHGLPFVIVEIPVAAYGKAIPAAPLLEEHCRSDLIGSLMFYPIGPDLYGFRRKFFRWAFFPLNLMHGMLHFDRAQDRLVLKGFFNLWIALLILAAGVFLLTPLAWSLKLLPLGLEILVIGIPLVLEARRCLRIARFAANAWESISNETTTAGESVLAQ